MSEAQELILKEGDEEFKVYIAPKEDIQFPEDTPEYRDVSMPTVNLQEVHNTIRGYARYAIGAFRNFGLAEVEKVTLKFNLKIAGKAGVPMLTEGSAESNFEIQVECKFPNTSKTSS